MKTTKTTVATIATPRRLLPRLATTQSPVTETTREAQTATPAVPTPLKTPVAEVAG